MTVKKELPCPDDVKGHKGGSICGFVVHLFRKFSLFIPSFRLFLTYTYTLFLVAKVCWIMSHNFAAVYTNTENEEPPKFVCIVSNVRIFNLLLLLHNNCCKIVPAVQLRCTPANATNL